ncbi:MAG: FAD-binding oxidoreductase [Pseudomonadota bacterium]
MENITYTTLGGTSKSLNATALEALAAGISGGIVTPRDGDYDAARKIWNGMVDRHPAVIARCRTARDASHAIVTADGELRKVSATQEPNLFWAIRGGGGNFGVVTAFEFRLHPVGPEVYAGLVVYPADQARQVLRAWRDFTVSAPEELSVWTVLRKAPPLPFLPESIHGRDAVIFALVHAGDIAAGEQAAAPVPKFGTPAGSHLGATPYSAFQAAFDPLLEPGARNYWKSHNFAKVYDAMLEVVIAAAAAAPGSECEVFIAQLGGAMTRVAPADTAYAGRDANYQRLQEVKRRYDPDNLFRMNINVDPGAAKAA